MAYTNNKIWFWCQTSKTLFCHLGWGALSPFTSMFSIYRIGLGMLFPFKALWTVLLFEHEMCSIGLWVWTLDFQLVALFGKAVRCLGGRAMLEEVCHWWRDLRIYNQPLITVFFLFPRVRSGRILTSCLIQNSQKNKLKFSIGVGHASGYLVDEVRHKDSAQGSVLEWFSNNLECTRIPWRPLLVSTVRESGNWE